MDKDQIIKDILKLREEKMACAPSTLIGVCRNIDCDLTEEELALLSSGFGGGIGGNTEPGTCGAIAGVTIALGLKLDDAGKIKEISKIIFDDFKKEFGFVECNKLTDNGDDKTHCTGYCEFVGERFVDLV